MFEFSIFGSCVSRDAVEFVKDAKVIEYYARQSVVSAASQMPDSQWLGQLRVDNSAHEFHKRCIIDDFHKDTLRKIDNSVADQRMWVIDFIEERVPLGRTPCGNVVTISQAATGFSNINELSMERIAPYSSEHIDLFEKAVSVFAQSFSGKKVILHHAYYAAVPGGDHEMNRANEVLKHFYELALREMQHAVVLEIEAGLVKSSEKHKWGLAPYHYHDEYYLRFVEKLSLLTGRCDISAKDDFSLQKERQ